MIKKRLPSTIQTHMKNYARKHKLPFGKRHQEADARKLGVRRRNNEQNVNVSYRNIDLFINFFLLGFQVVNRHPSFDGLRP